MNTAHPAFLTRLSLLLLLGLLPLLAGGCPKTGSGQTDPMHGVWYDGGGAAYTFDDVNGALAVTQIIDSDGEEFVVQEYGWDQTFSPARYYWVYLVPSTGYVVRHTIVWQKGKTFEAEWSNQEAAGSDTFTKRR